MKTMLQPSKLRVLLLVLLMVPLVAACDTSGSNEEEPPSTQRFRIEIANVQDAMQGAPFPILKSGAFGVEGGASETTGPIGPGGAYEFTFTAPPNVTPGSGMRLSFATMFVQSNDLFYAFEPEGLPLYDADGNAMTGDVTSAVALWDAGTEVNEAPGEGTNQAPRQDAPNTGPDEDGTIQRIDDGTEGPGGYTYPNVADVIRVTLSHDGETMFTLRIENVSDTMTLQTSGGSVAVPLSPGTFAVHTEAATFFETGAAASDGIEAIAEDGMPGTHAEALADLTGLTVPLSPGAFAVHTMDAQLFEDGGTASPGIEDIAEDGVPSALVDALTGADGVQSVAAFGVEGGASETTGPIGPGGSYTFEVEATPGDHLSFATMYVQSNDFFYAFASEGLALFDGDDMPISGEVTGEVTLWDAGTEVDEEPGVGLNQIIRSGPDVGPDEDGSIVQVDGENDGYTYPPVEGIIRVTVTPVP